jgi:malonate-semialdehyde dehydrogenase (acetylating) / methylmalonate-semialdehyde dehydrogenase
VGYSTERGRQNALGEEVNVRQVEVLPRGSVQTLTNFVDGNWMPSTAEESMAVRNPATGEIVARVPMSTPDEVDLAVQAAHRAFRTWQHVPPIERARYLFALRDLLVAHVDDLARLVTIEHGKTLADSRGSVQRAIENVEVAAGIPSLMMGYGLTNGAGRDIDEEAVRRPIGVFAGIAPFNFPMMVPFWFLPYAIGTGNTFILKPSEQVPMSQAFVFGLIEQLDLPPGVVSLINGGPDVVNALIDHPLVRGISFVGSTPVAKAVYARAAAHGKRVQAAGGAKNVMVVMPDAVIDKVIPNVINAAFGSAGQRCLAGSVLMPIGAAHVPVRDALLEDMKHIRVGNGLNPDVTMGPVISPSAKTRILQAIEQGLADGATLLFGGGEAVIDEYPNGNFIEPTLFDDVTPEMPLASQEIFGPVLSIMPVDTLDDAIRYIDSNTYGNAASVFTQSGAAAREFQTRLDVGNIGINIGVAAPMAYFPFGGARESFFGTLHGQGRDAIDFFTDRQVVIRRWFEESREHAGKHW